ncbi:MAG TPA: hypothetical protein VF292_14225 [Rhodanobacteraceae bacterium]
MVAFHMAEWLLGGRLMMLGLSFAWFLLLPARIAARVAWGLLVATWRGASWAVHAIDRWRVRARRHPGHRHGA